jgi:hypothetical protein
MAVVVIPCGFNAFVRMTVSREAQLTPSPGPQKGWLCVPHHTPMLLIRQRKLPNWGPLAACTRKAMLGKVLRLPGEALSPVENDVQRVCRTALVLSLLAHRTKRLVAKVFGSIEAEIDSVVCIVLALNSNLSRSAYDDMRSMTGLCPSRSRPAIGPFRCSI